MTSSMLNVMLQKILHACLICDIVSGPPPAFQRITKCCSSLGLPLPCTLIAFHTASEMNMALE